MIWLTLQELTDIGVPRQTQNRRIKKGEWRSRLGARRASGNGKALREVLLESLPQDLQLRYWKLKQAESSLTTETFEDDAGAADALHEEVALDAEAQLTQSLIRYAPEQRDAFLKEAQRLLPIVERYEAISPKRVRSAEGKHEFVPEVLRLCDEARCMDPVILAIEPARGKARSPHTLDSWAKAVKTEGLATFLRKPPTPTGMPDKRKAEISAEAIEWINANWRKKPSPWKLHSDLKKVAARRGWTVPSYGWIYHRYKSLPKIVSTLAFEGEKAYTGRYAPFVPRTVADLAALQILVGDHSVRDVTVMLPTGELTRPWLTMWQDLRTGLIWGWHLDLTPSSNTIGLAYVDGVRNFGAQPLSNPDADFFSYLYTDQGKDYRSKTLTGQTLEFKKAARIEGGLGVLCTQRKVGFMDELGIKHLMARGYNAREKSIERTHKDISSWEQNTFEAEYCGRGTEHKPERWQKAWHTQPCTRVLLGDRGQRPSERTRRCRIDG